MTHWNRVRTIVLDEIRLQFGHAQRAWDDMSLPSRQMLKERASIRPRPEGVG